jgi:hypothetical protein
MVRNKAKVSGKNLHDLYKFGIFTVRQNSFESLQLFQLEMVFMEIVY